jgi:hypothetical protein
VLHGSELARTWTDAQFRICFAKNKTDEEDGYALCLDSLIGVLPLTDKTYYYRRRVAPGDVVADLLRTTPVHFGLIDATVSAHGMGGARAPVALQTHCVLASQSVTRLDHAGALKMGLDPHRSRLADRVFKSVGSSAGYDVSGSLAVYPGWVNVHPLILESRRHREKFLAADRLLTPWLQRTNPELFPLKHPIDAKVNAALSDFFSDVGSDLFSFWLMVSANYAIGNLNEWIGAYRVLYDKDAIRQVQAPLGLRLEEFSAADFRTIVAELSNLETLLKDVKPAAQGLRWCYDGGATVFECSRDLPVPFEEFIEHVDVAKTIQYMNDYIGGVVVPVERDAAGRVIRQAERNLYLPQPNYLALYQGKPIDVSKIEVCQYSPSRQRMFWKTMKSENNSAVCDDGIVTFTRTEMGTRVEIVGKQLFVLPPFWQAVNLDLFPDFKAQLVTHAYKTFFDRTFANLEALVEGRDIRIGRPWATPKSVEDTEPFPIESIAAALQRIGDKLRGVLEAGGFEKSLAGPNREAASHVDEDGFRHFTPAVPASAEVSFSEARSAVQEILETVGGFYSGLLSAAVRDGLRSFQPSAPAQS